MAMTAKELADKIGDEYRQWAKTAGEEDEIVITVTAKDPGPCGSSDLHLTMCTHAKHKIIAAALNQHFNEVSSNYPLALLLLSSGTIKKGGAMSLDEQAIKEYVDRITQQ